MLFADETFLWKTCWLEFLEQVSIFQEPQEANCKNDRQLWERNENRNIFNYIVNAS